MILLIFSIIYIYIKSVKIFCYLIKMGLTSLGENIMIEPTKQLFEQGRIMR